MLTLKKTRSSEAYLGEGGRRLAPSPEVEIRWEKWEKEGKFGKM